MVVSGREGLLHGEVRQVAEGNDSEDSRKGFGFERSTGGTGEPDAVKVARPVRWGVVAKVPYDGNSVATYLTRPLATMNMCAFDEGLGGQYTSVFV